MKKFFWNKDLRNEIIGGIYFTILSFIATLIFTFFKSVIENSTFKKSFYEFYILLSDNLYLTLTIAIIATILFVNLYKNYLNYNPIKWNFEHFLGMIGNGKDGITDWQIISFQATGKNRLYEPITNIYGYIEILRNNERFPIMFNNNGAVVNPEKFISLPKYETIGVVSFFSENENYSSPKGIDPKEFLKTFVPFKFIVVINGKEFGYFFSKEKVEKNIKEVIDQNFIEKKPQKNKGAIFKN